MVSGDYVVFRANESRLLSDYLNHLRRSTAWADFVGASGNGSVRVRIWFDDLGRFKFLLPSLAEQRAIAHILDAADTELRLLRSQRAALDQQKRGLMQRLLTGKVRVNV
jgi:type I restriction enzyme S subunit